MYYFKKKIKCAKCDGNFRGINERGKKKYYCSTYHNYRTCIRWNIEETWLVDLVYDHFIIDSLKLMREHDRVEKLEESFINDLVDRVKGVEVDPEEKSITILYIDGTKTIINENRIASWTYE